MSKTILWSILSCAVCLAGGCTDSESPDLEEPAKTSGSETAKDSPVTMMVDYSNAPEIVLDARGTGLHTILTNLAEQLDFVYSRSAQIKENRPVNAVITGTVEEVLDWLLFGESYVMGYATVADTVKISTLQWLAHGTSSTPFTHTEAVVGGETVIGLDVASIDAYLQANPDLNKDIESWLTQLSGASHDTERVRISLYDAPASITEMMERIAYPNTDDFVRNRRENRAPGTPPRHLTSSNDAAQNDIAQALARTTAMARRNLEALKRALETACPHADCPSASQIETTTTAEPGPSKPDAPTNDS
jgi:hypothetical protein